MTNTPMSTSLLRARNKQNDGEPTTRDQHNDDWLADNRVLILTMPCLSGTVPSGCQCSPGASLVYSIANAGVLQHSLPAETTQQKRGDNKMEKWMRNGSICSSDFLIRFLSRALFKTRRGWVLTESICTNEMRYTKITSYSSCPFTKQWNL